MGFVVNLVSKEFIYNLVTTNKINNTQIGFSGYLHYCPNKTIC